MISPSEFRCSLGLANQFRPDHIPIKAEAKNIQFVSLKFPSRNGREGRHGRQRREQAGMIPNVSKNRARNQPLTFLFFLVSLLMKDGKSQSKLMFISMRPPCFKRHCQVYLYCAF